ncbi:MAG: GNAT family N-acetyltransferase [Jatrophihabitans sp.]|uniref:GNAT family N-acetyltransferase n=1 Tax=Jatrophihabitans sp. TaxID=1932789 RepID=UPI003F7ED5B0
MSAAEQQPLVDDGAVGIEARRVDDPAVAPLIAAVQRYYVETYGGEDDDPTPPEAFAPPHGVFLLGREQGRAVAMGGFRRVDDRTVEIKRMYVDPSARGRGWGRRMVRALEREARAAGATRVVLNTGFRQQAAIALYEAEGYVPGGRFGHYADQPGALFFAKTLNTPA